MRHCFPAASLVALTAVMVVGGCSPSSPPAATSTETHKTGAGVARDSAAADAHHSHVSGAHGGAIVSLGRDSYHVEAIVTSAGELRLYILGADERRVAEIDSQDITAYAKPVAGGDAVPVELKPEPQAGDTAGKASLFLGNLPAPLLGKSLQITVPNITIAGERFRLGFTTDATEHAEITGSRELSDAAGRELYLTPGGLYTQADIEANGAQTAAQKFSGFQAVHDRTPKVGDKICPITLTKANLKCSWIVAGKLYEFCCPPCVDEFVTLAKTKPDEIKAPDAYVQRESGATADPR